MNDQSVITAIEKQKSKKRYNIYIDDVYSFSVHEDILIKYRLNKGKQLGMEEWKEVLAAEEQNRVKQYAYSYLSYRARTTAQLHEYLLSKGFTDEDCRGTVSHCMEMGYIDDNAFAEGWLESRKRSRPRGRNLLRAELLSKGIDESTVDAQLSATISREDEEEMIEELLKKKLKLDKFESIFELKKKVIPYLQRKGFNLDEIFHVIEKLKHRYLL